MKARRVIIIFIMIGLGLELKILGVGIDVLKPRLWFVVALAYAICFND